MQSEIESIKRLKSPKSKVSCHYLINREGTVIQMVKDKNLFSKLNVSKYTDRKIYHMRGKDISGKNNLTYI